MRGPHVDAFPSLGIDPTAEDATAWKRECVYAIITDDLEYVSSGVQALHGPHRCIDRDALDFGLENP